MPAAGRGRGARAPRRRSGRGGSTSWRGRRRDGCAARASPSRGSCARGRGEPLRRAHRRLSRAPRPARGAARGARKAGRLQPARLARGHARRRPRALPAAARWRRAALARDRPARVPRAPTSSSRDTRGARRASSRSLGGLDRVRGLPRRRRGARCSGRAGRREEPFTRLFVGKLIPLHGLETILAAARLAPEIPFRVVGSGQLDALLADPPANVERALGRLRAAAGGAARGPAARSGSSGRRRRRRG